MLSDSIREKEVIANFKLESVNIYEMGVENKINNLVEENMQLFDKDNYYRIDIKYSLKEKVFENSVYNIEYLDSITPFMKKRKEKDIRSDALSSQLHKIGDCFINKGINAIDFSVGGEPSDKNTINIQICKTTKISDIKLYSIHPEYTPEEEKRANERTLQKLYEILFKDEVKNKYGINHKRYKHI
jgi:hypothetical protein